MKHLYFCPSCFQAIEIIETNCGIFRCGVMKDTMRQIDPHLSQSECERLVDDDLIYGCARPFKYTEGCLVVCDYM
jgi:hypothetical protein